MIINISFKGMEASENIQRVIERKTQDLKHHLNKPCKIDWICENHNGLRKCKTTLISPYKTIETESTNNSIYNSIDKVIEKIRYQVLNKDQEQKKTLKFEHVFSS